MRVLVVEDEPKMAALVQRGLVEEGLVADVAHSAEDALGMLAAVEYQAMVLDLGLPGMDGVELCRHLRATEAWLPILVLTARDGLRDRVGGLDAGADDYLVKPVHPDELGARLRALLRRAPQPRPSVLEVGALRLDPATRRVHRDGEEVLLAPRELALLEVLMRTPGQAVSRSRLVDAVFDGTTEHRSNVIDVHMSAMRRKLGQAPHGGPIQTVRGVGYRIVQDDG